VADLRWANLLHAGVSPASAHSCVVAHPPPKLQVALWLSPCYGAVWFNLTLSLKDGSDTPRAGAGAGGGEGEPVFCDWAGKRWNKAALLQESLRCDWRDAKAILAFANCVPRDGKLAAPHFPTPLSREEWMAEALAVDSKVSGTWNTLGNALRKGDTIRVNGVVIDKVAAYKQVRRLGGRYGGNGGACRERGHALRSPLRWIRATPRRCTTWRCCCVATRPRRCLMAPHCRRGSCTGAARRSTPKTATSGSR